MRKKSFWLSLNPWDPPPSARMRRPPRRFPGIRRPVSSEAPGRGGVPARHERGKPRSGRSPLRRSPFPSASSSSSSFISCGFPRLFRLLLQLRGSAPGAASPGRLSDSPSIGFKSVKIMFGLSSRSGAAPAASVVPSGFVFRLPPPCPVPAPAEFGSSSDGRPSAVRDPGLPPGPGLLFRSFAVRFVHGSYLRFVLLSVQFSSLQFRSSCLVRFRSFSFVSVSFRCFVFELIFACCARSQAILLYISRVYYTLLGVIFKCIFYQKTCRF